MIRNRRRFRREIRGRVGLLVDRRGFEHLSGIRECDFWKVKREVAMLRMVVLGSAMADFDDELGFARANNRSVQI